jgi:hypothetical protein
MLLAQQSVLHWLRSTRACACIGLLWQLHSSPMQAREATATRLILVAVAAATRISCLLLLYIHTCDCRRNLCACRIRMAATPTSSLLQQLS